MDAGASRSAVLRVVRLPVYGNIVKVTPSSKVVGDLALHLVAVAADPAEFADDPGRFAQLAG